MADTITVYSGEEETVTYINAIPDPEDPGHYLIKNFEDGKPLRCKLSLKAHSYNVVMPPESFVIIDADFAETLKESRSDDRAVFILPRDEPEAYYMEQYISASKGRTPYTVVLLRQKELFKIISAALYPRDLEELPEPLCVGPDKTKTLTPIEMKKGGDFAPNPYDIEYVLRVIYKPVGKSIIDPNAPKEGWF